MSFSCPGNPWVFPQMSWKRGLGSRWAGLLYLDCAQTREKKRGNIDGCVYMQPDNPKPKFRGVCSCSLERQSVQNTQSSPQIHATGNFSPNLEPNLNHLFNLLIVHPMVHLSLATHLMGQSSWNIHGFPSFVLWHSLILSSHFPTLRVLDFGWKSLCIESCFHVSTSVSVSPCGQVIIPTSRAYVLFIQLTGFSAPVLPTEYVWLLGDLLASSPWFPLDCGTLRHL